MATPLRMLFQLGKKNVWQTKHDLINFKRFFSRSSNRYILPETYFCNEAWRSHINDPNLGQVSLTDFGYQLRDEIERSGHASAVDVNVLAHQLSSMDDDEADFVEDLIAKFNMCQSSIPRNDSTCHAIVRGFLSKPRDGASRLVRLLSNRMQYGLFPDHYTLNLLLDQLIESRDWPGAARVAYHSMLQEDLGSCPPSHTLLCLHAVVQRLVQGSVSDLALPPVDKPVDEEEDWIKVKYIKFPVYDDHFDIKDERFLLGKTLHALSHVHNIPLPEQIRNSLSVIGSSIHHKFSQGLGTLDSVLSSPSATISQHALEMFTETLANVEARDPEEPEVELAIRTIDDVIHRHLPTTTEKEEIQSMLERTKEQLVLKDKVDATFDLSKCVSDLVVSELPAVESDDMKAYVSRLEVWRDDRDQELRRQVETLRQMERLEEMKKQVKELQEKEEILSYFDFEENIRLTFLDEDQMKDEGLTISK